MDTAISRRPLTAFHLKLIALTTMIADHVAAALDIIPRGPNNLMRSIGRIAFPLYAFYWAYPVHIALLAVLKRFSPI